MRKNKILPIAALAILGLTLPGCAAQGNQEGTSGEPKVGPEITYYSGTGLPADLVDALAGPFAEYMDEKYGVPVRVNNVVGAIPNSWAALKTEWPNPSGDAYLLYNDQVRQGIEDGWWTPLRPEYTDEEWAAFDQDALKTLNTDGYTVPQDISAYVLAVQDSVPESAADSWRALGDSQFKNRTTFDSALAVGSGYNAIAAAAIVLGEDWNTWFEGGEFNADLAKPTFDLVAKWADNSLTLTEGSGSITPLLARGEAQVSAWWWHNAVQEMDKGTPIRVVYPKEGVLAYVQSGPVASAKSSNPVAAIEWVKFYQSDVAAQAALDLGYLNRMPRSTDPKDPAFEEFQKAAKFVWIDDFRDQMLDPAYNREVLDLYTKVVIQGQ